LLKSLITRVLALQGGELPLLQLAGIGEIAQRHPLLGHVEGRRQLNAARP
jgi:hypothetical protein